MPCRGAKPLPRCDNHRVGIGMLRIHFVGILGEMMDTDRRTGQDDDQDGRQYFNPFQNRGFPPSSDGRHGSGFNAAPEGANLCHRAAAVKGIVLGRQLTAVGNSATFG